MNLAIDIPDEIASQLGAKPSDVSRAVLEAVAIEGYRTGCITPAQIQEMLSLPSRWAVDEFLRHAEAYDSYSMADLEEDLAAIRSAGR